MNEGQDKAGSENKASKPKTPKYHGENDNFKDGIVTNVTGSVGNRPDSGSVTPKSSFSSTKQESGKEPVYKPEKLAEEKPEKVVKVQPRKPENPENTPEKKPVKPKAPEPSAPTPDEISKSSSAPDGAAKRPKNSSLLDLYLDSGFSIEGVEKFLRGRIRADASDFEESDVVATLDVVKEADPDLVQTRRLLYVSLEKHDGRFAMAACSFATKVLTRVMDESTKNLVDDRGQPEDSLAAFVGNLTPEISDEATQNSAHNALMIFVDILSWKTDLTFERSVPAISRAVGPPAEYGGRTGTNRRRHRIATVTRPSNELKQTRDLLDLFGPFETDRDHAVKQVELMSSERDESVDKAEKAQVESDRLTERVAELDEEIRGLRQELAVQLDVVKDARISAGAEVSKVKARTAGFFNSRLRGLLEMAKEACEIEPPLTGTAVRQLDQAMGDIEREIEWLKSSD